MSQSDAPRFDVDAFLDERPVGGAHVKLIALLMLAMLLDGYDIFLIGTVMPFLAKDLGVTPASLTSVFVIQQLGLFIGTLFVGPLSDRYGRRTTLLACIGAFTALTIATTAVSTPGQLIAIRFVSSLFFAGVIPNAIALSSELAPRRWRAGIVSLVFSGFTGGHFIGSFAQAYLLEDYGWRSAFWLGGVLGVAIFIVLFMTLAESIRFQVRRNDSDPRVATALRRLDPTLELPQQVHFEVRTSSPQGQRVGARTLFEGDRKFSTPLVWIAFFCAFLVSQLMGSWSTTVLHNLADVSMQRIAAAGALATVLGIVGTASAGFFLDRFSVGRSIPLFFLGGAAATMTLGLIDLHSSLFLLVISLQGYFANSALGAINALGSLIYPSQVRATGVAWAAAAGRAGGMVGPALGGALLGLSAAVSTIFLITSIPLIIAAAAVTVVAVRIGTTRQA